MTKLPDRLGRRAALGLVALLLLAQLARPERPGAQGPGEGPVTDHFSVPPLVQIVLERACYDCHSAHTRWPWYSRIVPVSWLVVHDVRRGRRDLDFSNWSTEPGVEPTPEQRLRWTCEEAREDRMPPATYRLLHPDARLADDEKDVLCAWTEEARASLR